MIVDEDEFLEHYGKKGMKWGVRKSRGILDSNQAKRQKQADRLKRVGNKNSNLRDKGVAALTTGTHHVVLAGGARKGAARKGQKLQEHIDRVEKGEVKVKDILRIAGSTSYRTVYRGLREKDS